MEDEIVTHHLSLLYKDQVNGQVELSNVKQMDSKVRMVARWRTITFLQIDPKHHSIFLPIFSFDIDIVSLHN